MEVIFSRAAMSPYIFWGILPKATGPFGQFVAIVATTGGGLVTESPLKKKPSSLPPYKSNILNHTTVLKLHVIKELISKPNVLLEKNEA